MFLSPLFFFRAGKPVCEERLPQVLARPVLMTACVPVLLRTTLSQRAVPATLPLGLVLCRILGGRTV